MNILIKSVEWHRNGVGGFGFCSVLFSLEENGIVRENMHASVFSEYGYCAVHDLDDMEKAWRGENFQEELLDQIAQAMAEEEEAAFPNYN